MSQESFLRKSISQLPTGGIKEGSVTPTQEVKDSSDWEAVSHTTGTWKGGES